jgi:hypothetical protein
MSRYREGAYALLRFTLGVVFLFSGTIAAAPDYYKIRKASTAENFDKTASKPSVESRGSNSTSRINSDPSIESRASSASKQTQPQEQKPKKKGLFARLLRLGRN